MNTKQLKAFDQVLEALKGTNGNIGAPQNYTHDDLLNQIASSIRNLRSQMGYLERDRDEVKKTNSALNAKMEEEKKNLAEERANMTAKIHEDIGKGMARALFGNNLAISRWFYGPGEGR